MIPRACKRLAEVDFPIAVVSKHAAREKSIRHGHPSTLHLWWARRPLASSRAVLLALLLPDPCDEHGPEAFKERVREILREVRQPPTDDVELRKALLWFIGAFANWDMAANQTYLNVGRNLVRAAHGEAPLVVSPEDPSAWTPRSSRRLIAVRSLLRFALSAIRRAVRVRGSRPQEGDGSQGVGCRITGLRRNGADGSGLRAENTALKDPTSWFSQMRSVDR